MSYFINPKKKDIAENLLKIKNDATRSLFLLTNPFIDCAISEITKFFKNNRKGYKSLSIDFNDSNKVRNLLGSSVDLLYINISGDDESNFSLNHFFACLGLVKASGIIVIKFPEKNVSSTDLEDGFNSINLSLPYTLQFILKIIDVNKESKYKKPFFKNNSIHTNQVFNKDSLLNKSVVLSLLGHKKLVLMGDRGVGKSTLLKSLTCLRLLEGKSILFLSKKVKENYFTDILEHFDSDIFFKIFSDRGKINLVKSNIYKMVCVAPIELLKKNIGLYNYIMVDEISSFSFTTLSFIINSKTPFILSGTVSGYEGSGQSTKNLLKDASKRGITHSVLLNEKFRYKDCDSLSMMMSDICFIKDDNTKNNKKQGIDLSNIIIFRLKPSILLDTNFLLSVYKFLMSGHYRTSPNDFSLLFSSSCEIYVAFYKGLEDINLESGIVAALLCINESLKGTSENYLNDVVNGKRRAKGNLIIQNLVSGYSVKEFAMFHVKRVQRVVVKKDFRGNGVATLLVEKIDGLINKENETASKKTIFAISCGGSFINTSFWLSNDFKPIKVGVKKDKWQGVSSIIFIKKDSLNLISKEAKNILVEESFNDSSFYEFYCLLTLITYEDKYIDTLGDKVYNRLLISLKSSFSQLNRDILRKSLEVWLKECYLGHKEILWTAPLCLLLKNNLNTKIINKNNGLCCFFDGFSPTASKIKAIPYLNKQEKKELAKLLLEFINT